MLTELSRHNFKDVTFAMRLIELKQQILKNLQAAHSLSPPSPQIKGEQIVPAPHNGRQ